MQGWDQAVDVGDLGMEFEMGFGRSLAFRCQAAQDHWG